MTGCGAVHAVDAFRSDFHGGRKAESHVRSPNIVVDRLGKPDDFTALRGEQSRRFVRPCTAERHEAVETELLVSFLHFIEFGAIIAVGDGHLFEGLAFAAQHRTAGEQ